MTVDTDTLDEQPEDNEVIRKLRADLKEANAKAKTAAEDAIAKVKRDADAKGLMPEGFKGLSDIFESEVDGELTTESAAAWLQARGITATPEAISEVTSEARELEEVTNLSGAAAAASNLLPEDTITKRIADAEEGLVGAGSIADLTARLAAALGG